MNGCVALQVLDVRDNAIADISYEALAPLRALKTLDLRPPPSLSRPDPQRSLVGRAIWLAQASCETHRASLCQSSPALSPALLLPRCLVHARCTELPVAAHAKAARRARFSRF
jgi:hypothetical protein